MTAASTNGSEGAVTRGRRGRRPGPPLALAAIGLAGILLGALLVVAQTLGIGGASGAAVPTTAPAGAAAARTHDLVAAALAARAIQVVDPQTPYRPGESPSLVSVPRRVLQIVVPDDPGHGYVIIYELPTPQDADRVGGDFVRYLAAGTGAIQYPRDTQFVVRRVGQTLVFLPWSSSVSPDPRMAEAAAVIAGLGSPVAGG